MEYHGAPASWISSHDNLASCQDYEIPEVQPASSPQQNLEADVTVDESEVLTSEDQTRRTGDVTIWMYYGKSIGILLIISAVSLVAIEVFCHNFQGT